MARKYSKTPRPADICPQCQRENVRTYREIVKRYVCRACADLNES